ncbi:MAG TPA: biotin transporter BioY, partial [Lacipirellulaceae bacterium]|nr:biotin transporter BioY [Lacipirellulaceae bacterium]
PAGPGGIAQLLGITGGYLMAYPVAAFVAGWIAERGSRNLLRSSIAALSGEALVFAGGIAWLSFAWHAPISKAAAWGVYPFAFAEIIKVMAVVAASARLHRSSKLAGLLA